MLWLKEKGKWKVIATDEEKRKFREAVNRHQAWWDSLPPEEQKRILDNFDEACRKIAREAKAFRDYQTSPEALEIYRRPITI